MKHRLLLPVVMCALVAAGCSTFSSSPQRVEGPERSLLSAKRPQPTPEELSARVAQELKSLGEKDVVTEKTEPGASDQPSKVTYDIPIVINKEVQESIDYFQSQVPKRFALWLSRSGRYLPMMRGILRQYGLPEDLAYLAMIESGFSCQAYSRAHAVGPWQFIQGTGRRYNLKINYWVDERRDPVKSTHAAARYLKDLHDEFGSWYLAAAAYNAGEAKIRKALKRYNADDFWSISKARGNYIKRETKQYVPKMIAAALIAKEPEKYGFTNIAYQPPMTFDTVQVHPGTALGVAAKLAGISTSQLSEINPELRRWATPPVEGKYSLRIPQGRKIVFDTAYAQLPPPKRLARIGAVTVRVSKGDTLGRLARAHGVKLNDLLAANPGLDPRRLRLGQKVVIPSNEKVKVYAQARRSEKSLPRLASKPRGVQKIVHTVRPGDTLWHIARSYNIDWRQIVRWNDQRNGRIKSGQKLVLYVPSAKAEGKLVTGPASKSDRVVYVVKRGDNLWNIGRRFKVTPAQLKRWNGLTSNDITPGDRLMVKRDDS